MTFDEFKTLARKKAPDGFGIAVKVANELNCNRYEDDFYTVCYFLNNSKLTYTGESTDPKEAIEMALGNYMLDNHNF